MYKPLDPSPRSLGNIELKYADLIAQAATETGFDVRATSPGVDPATGQPAFHFSVAVWTYEPRREHGPFWAAYHRLKAAAAVAEQEAT